MMMCKAATRLMSKQLDAPLTARERISLRFHLMLCSACRNCEKQFGMLHRVGNAYNGTIDKPQDGTSPGATTDNVASDQDLLKVKQAMAEAETRRQN
ncbi:zf-HC2 domain-containing protein [Halomonas sp. SCS19]|uniref:zf-HC2 domain-containing protein n=1 Tax=Halomonas sp. SCS19 TaxID=2950870 RepID=UPI0032DFF36B